MSCILVNTEQGAKLFKEVKSRLTVISSIMEKAQAKNGQIVKCSKLPTERAEFLEKFSHEDYDAFYREWKKASRMVRLKLTVADWIPPKMKTQIKRILRM